MSHFFVRTGNQDGFVSRALALTVATSTVVATPDVRFLPTLVLFRVAVASGFVSAATLSVGTNAATYNNIIPGTALTGFNTADQLWGVLVPPLAVAVSAGTGIRVNVTVAAVATTLTSDVWILGVRDS